MESPATDEEKRQSSSRAKTRVMNLYIWKLSLAAGLGGLLFGYDTGVISGALLYIRDDFASVDRDTSLQEAIVSTAIAGAIVGAAVGGKLSDRFGRKPSILAADAVFVIGAIVMAAASSPVMIIIGRVVVGVGIGIASMASPLYIAEASPAEVRGALVSVNNLMITGGQFVAYLINFGLTELPGTWRWMLGVSLVPALIQFFAMLVLPESPRWLYRQGKNEASEAVLRQIYPAGKIEAEIDQLQKSVDEEKGEEASGHKAGLRDVFKTKEMRLALLAGVGLQVFQQFAGINTVMYYAPSILELAGYASHQTALLLSLLTSGLNALGTVAGIIFIDRLGRRRLAISSLAGVIVALALLTWAFRLSNGNSPALRVVSSSFDLYTCPDYSSQASVAGRHCVQCLKSSSPSCGFCAALGNKQHPGECLISNKTVGDFCTDHSRLWFTHGCPSNYGWFALLSLALYIAAFSPGMGPVPWAINSEIYPLKFRGLCGGIAATANWMSNLIVAQSFLSMTKALGTSNTFLVFGILSFSGLVFVFLFLPETKGLSFADVEMLWQRRASGGWRALFGLGKKSPPHLSQHKLDQERAVGRQDFEDSR